MSRENSKIIVVLPTSSKAFDCKYCFNFTIFETASKLKVYPCGSGLFCYCLFILQYIFDDIVNLRETTILPCIVGTRDAHPFVIKSRCPSHVIHVVVAVGGGAFRRRWRRDAQRQLYGRHKNVAR